MYSKEHVFDVNLVPLKKSMSVRDILKTLITKVICFRFFNICSLVSFLLCAAFKNKAFVGNETLIPIFYVILELCLYYSFLSVAFKSIKDWSFMAKVLKLVFLSTRGKRTKLRPVLTILVSWKSAIKLYFGTVDWYTNPSKMNFFNLFIADLFLI